MKKAFACILALWMLALPLAGCGEDGDSSSAASSAGAPTSSAAASSTPSDIKLGVAIATFEGYTLRKIRDSIRSAATAKGIAEANLHISDGQSDVPTQIGQVENFLSQNVDVLILNPVEIIALDGLEESLPQVLVNSAKTKATPVVFVNRMPEDDIIQSYEKCYYVGSNPNQNGTNLGEVMAKWWSKHPEADKNADGKMQYVMVMGGIASPEAKARTFYAIKAIEDAGIEVDPLEEDTANWNKTEAFEKMDTWWAEHGDAIEVIMANNDDMALGALKLLQSKGYNTGDMSKFIPIVGIDGTPDGQAAVRAGEMVGTVRQDPQEIGRACVAVAFALYEGKAITPANIDGFEVYDKDANQAATGRYIWVPYVQLTQENVDNYPG